MSLVELPNEILLMIIRLDYQQKDRVSLAKTCQRLYALLLPVIYQSLSLTDHQACRFFSSPSVCNWLGNVESLSWKENQQSNLGIGHYVFWISQMRQLKRLQIESPFFYISRANTLCRYDRNLHNGQDSPLKSFQQEKATWAFELQRLADMFHSNSILDLQPMVLPNLHECHIHLSEPIFRNWFVDLKQIFFSGSIIKLCLEGCFLDDGLFINYRDCDGPDIRRSLHRSTPLQHLVLLECTVGSVTMFQLMQIPRALKTLRIHSTERIFPPPHDCGFRRAQRRKFELRNRIVSYIGAWTLQSTALEDLRLSLPSYEANWTSATSISFRRFQKLRTLNLGSWPGVSAFLADVQPPPYLRELWVQFVIVQMGGLDREDQNQLDACLPILESRLQIAARFRERGCDHLQKIMLPLWFMDQKLPPRGFVMKKLANQWRWLESEERCFSLFKEELSWDNLSHIEPGLLRDMLERRWAWQLWEFKKEKEAKLGVEIQLLASVFRTKQLSPTR